MDLFEKIALFEEMTDKLSTDVESNELDINDIKNNLAGNPVRKEAIQIRTNMLKSLLKG